MTGSPAAQRYAKALYDLAIEQDSLEAVRTDLEDLRSLCDQSPELATLFLDPVAEEEKQLAILKSLFEGKVDPLTMRFFAFLVEKERLGLTLEVCGVFAALVDEARGVVHALVSTARELEPSQLEAITARLNTRYEKNVELRTRIEPRLLAGFTVQVADEVIDLSIRTQLEQMRRSIVSA